jgi:hypothetical protein
MGRIDGRELHHRGRQEPLDIAHRGDQPAPLAVAERTQEGSGQFVAALVELRVLGEAGRRELRGANSPVQTAVDDPDHSVGLERTQKTTRVPGVEVQVRSQ